MILAGVDLAWRSEKNPSAIAYGNLADHVLSVIVIDPAVYGIDSVFDRLNGIEGLQGVSIDAPLIINNASGQRVCAKRKLARPMGPEVPLVTPRTPGFTPTLRVSICQSGCLKRISVT